MTPAVPLPATHFCRYTLKAQAGRAGPSEAGPDGLRFESREAGVDFSGWWRRGIRRVQGRTHFKLHL